MHLTGFAAIEYAEKFGLTLNKRPDRIDGPQQELSIAEDESLIYLDVPDAQYNADLPSDFEPERPST
jgi:hypothetical protein